MAPSGLLIILSSPSGGGKSTLGRLCLDRTENLVYSVSYTSRKPRGDERDGIDYHFVTRSDFLNLVKDGFFLEWEEVHGNFYGTSRQAVQVLLDAGQDVLLDIDVQGGLHVRKLMPERTVLVFVLPPSKQILQKRLVGRNTDSEDVVKLRMVNAEKEIARGVDYDYLIINDRIEEAANSLCCLVISERCRMSRQQGFLSQAGYLADKV
jgi:guanylate kinase